MAILVDKTKVICQGITLVVRLKGTNVDLGKQILAQSGLKIVPANNLTDAAKKITDEVRQRGVMLIATAALLAVPASLVGASVAQAQSPATPELSFVRSFIGTCLHYFPDIERVKQTANALKWPEIKNPDVKGMLGPADASVKWQGWLMKADGHAFLVGISESTEQGRTVRSCSLAADRIDLSSVYSTLERLVSLKKQLDFNEDGQRNQLWVYVRGTDRFALMATDGSPMKMHTLSLAITNAQPKDR